MRIKLVDVDSRIPNLALMKISSYYKSRNHICGFDISNPDVIYVSVIYKKNVRDALIYKNTLDTSVKKVVIGGSGYSLKKSLPDKIEMLKPDYDLYPSTFSQGYTTRGCDRKCYFCIVYKKEGCFKIVQHPREFHDERFDKIVFMDNNILLDKDWFNEVSNFCIDNDLKVWFTQGLDIRLLDEETCKIIKELKMFKTINFAFDWINLKDVVVKKIHLLKDNGINTRKKIMFYVYVDDDKDFDSGLERCNVLKDLDTNAFVMFNIDKKRTRRIKDLQRWSNRKNIYWSCSYNEYSTRNHFFRP